jgi:flavodoxin
MTTAIRYYSKFGHTKQMVEAIKDIVGATPKTVSEPLAEPVDVLFLGAGVFLGKVDGSVVRFINSLTLDKVKCVVCFGSCAIIKSPVPQMRKALEARGIRVSEQEFTCPGAMGPVKSGHPNATDIDNFKVFAKSVIGK